MTTSRLRATSVLLGAAKRPLADDVADAVTRVVVDVSANMPGSFEIRLRDSNGALFGKSGIQIGTVVGIEAPSRDGGQSTSLLTGEVTSVGGSYRGLTGEVIIRGYSKDHRMQRVKRSRAFLNMKDSDIASDIARKAKLTVGTISQSTAAHAHLAQINETDWEFLRRRASEIGFEVCMIDDKFCFQKAPTKRSGAAIELSRTRGLWSFTPRVTAANIVPDVEVRVWDPLARKVVAETASVASEFATLDRHDPSGTAGQFSQPAAPSAPARPNPALGELGPRSTDAYIVVDRPAGSGGAIASAAGEVAGALAHQLGAAFAEADADAVGDPAIQPGATVTVDGFADIFNGAWIVTNARHVFDVDEGGYRTYFSIHGREDRSLLGLTTDSCHPGTQLPGVVCGVVTDNNDPDNKGRVKVSLPWLDPDFVTDWAPVTQFRAGPRTGAMFLPAVGDQVLVGFEFGDARRPYVLGSLLTTASNYDIGGAPIKAAGSSTQVIRSGFASESGNLIAFYDDVPPSQGNPPPTASQLQLGAKDGKVSVVFDQVAGSITVTCKPGPPTSKSAAGAITIECGDAGKVDIKTGNGGTVNIDGGNQLSLTAKSQLKLECTGPVQIKGNPIQLN